MTKEDTKTIQLSMTTRFSEATNITFLRYIMVNSCVGQIVMATSQLPTSIQRGLSDEELLRKARSAKNGHRFTIRFEQRSDSPAQQRKYDTRNDAALALLVNLAWWSRCDRRQMRRLFKRSALGEEFGDTDDLGDDLDELIEAAIDFVGDDVYDPLAEKDAKGDQ